MLNNYVIQTATAKLFEKDCSYLGVIVALQMLSL